MLYKNTDLIMPLNISNSSEGVKHIRGLSIKYVDFPHISGSFQYFITKFMGHII